MKLRNIEIDCIKIYACIGVVLLHTIGMKTSTLNNMIYYLGTIAVPLFFMVNGYFVLNKDTSKDRKYYINKMFRLLFIVIIWNVLFQVCKLLLFGNCNNIVIEVVKSLLQKGDVYWLWFLGALIGLYCISPILYKILHNSKINRKFLIGIIILCECIYIYNLYRGYSGRKIIRQLVPQSLRMWTWIMYFYLGGYIRENKFLPKINNKYLFTITIWCIFYEVIVANKILHILYAESFYDNIFIVLWATAFFKVIESKKINLKYKDIIINTSNLTLGIYIIHLFFVEYIFKWVHDLNNSFINIIYFIGIFIISYIISYIIKKIPYLKKIIT